MCQQVGIQSADVPRYIRTIYLKCVTALVHSQESSVGGAVGAWKPCPSANHSQTQQLVSTEGLEQAVVILGLTVWD